MKIIKEKTCNLLQFCYLRDMKGIKHYEFGYGSYAFLVLVCIAAIAYRVVYFG